MHCDRCSAPKSDWGSLVPLRQSSQPAVDQIDRHRVLERQEHIGAIDAVETALHAEEPWLRIPFAHDADDAVVVLVDVDRLADAVAAAEDLLVEPVADHRHRLPPRVVVGAPATAVAKRHLQHREELAVDRIATELNRAADAPCACRHHRGRDGIKRGLPGCPMLMHQRHGVGVGQRIRRLLAGGAIAGPPRVDLRHEQP